MLISREGWSHRLSGLDVAVAVVALLLSLFVDAIVSGLTRGTIGSFWSGGLGHLGGAFVFGLVLAKRLRGHRQEPAASHGTPRKGQSVDRTVAADPPSTQSISL